MRVSETTEPALVSSLVEVGPLILQTFAWDMAPDAGRWRYPVQHAQEIMDLSAITTWLLPAYKGQATIDGAGYGVYDLYDLDEFDQKGIMPTKYGMKDEYPGATEALYEVGTVACADIVPDHRTGADVTETVRATPINPQNRHEAIGELETTEAWIRPTFLGRTGVHSNFTWDWMYFHGIDWDETMKRDELWLSEGKRWNEPIDTEFGNLDYPMGCDVYVTDPRVGKEPDR